VGHFITFTLREHNPFSHKASPHTRSSTDSKEGPFINSEIAFLAPARTFVRRIDEQSLNKLFLFALGSCLRAERTVELRAGGDMFVQMDR